MISKYLTIVAAVVLISGSALAQDNSVPRAMITHTVGLEALPAAFEALRQRSDQCKVLVSPAMS